MRKIPDHLDFGYLWPPVCIMGCFLPKPVKEERRQAYCP